MRHSRRIASEIARLQLEALIAQTGCPDAESDFDCSTAPLADLLVMGDDRRPYLVRRFVRSAAGRQSRLYGVSVSAADSPRRLRRPVSRMVVAVEPRQALNVPGPRPRATRWNDLDKVS